MGWPDRHPIHLGSVDSDPAGRLALRSRRGHGVTNMDDERRLKGLDERTRHEIARLEQLTGRRLYRRELRAVVRGEHILPSTVKGQTWLAHPSKAGGKVRVVQGGAPDSSRRRH